MLMHAFAQKPTLGHTKKALLSQNNTIPPNTHQMLYRLCKLDSSQAPHAMLPVIDDEALGPVLQKCPQGVGSSHQGSFLSCIWSWGGLWGVLGDPGLGDVVPGEGPTGRGLLAPQLLKTHGS